MKADDTAPAPHVTPQTPNALPPGVAKSAPAVKQGNTASTTHKRRKKKKKKPAATAASPHVTPQTPHVTPQSQ